VGLKSTLNPVRASRECPTHAAMRPRHEWGTRLKGADAATVGVLNYIQPVDADER
jgi:hypothetical protein